MIGLLSVLSLVTGIIFMVLEIFQNRYMWYADIITAGAAAAVAVISHLWASAALNLYFLVMAVVGLVRWKKLDEQTGEGEIHLVRMSPGAMAASTAMALAGGVLIWWALSRTDDPRPALDAVSFVLSIIATWWLTRSYLHQWTLWVVADALATWMYAAELNWSMAALYLCYIISSVIGFIHWRSRGRYISSFPKE